MKNRLLRVLALALLLAMAVGAVPAMAAKKVSLIPETLYANCGDFWIETKNWTGDERVIFVKSSDPSIIAVPEKTLLRIVPKKPGKAKITLKYELDGKRYSTSATFTVQKYPSPIKSLKINGTSVKLKNKDRLGCSFDFPDDGKKASVLINMKLASGWSISKIKAYYYNAFDDVGKHINFTVKNNKKFTLKADCEASISYTLKHKKGQTFNYRINLWRLVD